MAQWSKPSMPREQAVLFAPTLDATIPDDHPVRLYHEVLSRLDWSAWEAHYHGHRGQPALQPMLLAGLLLYGLRLGLRSSRKLEDGARNRLDLLWLLEGRQPDHATIAAFRTRFAGELKQLSREFVGLVLSMGLLDLGQVAVDGTRVAAHNSAGSVATAATLERRAAALRAELEAGLEELAANDAGEAGEGWLSELPRGLRSKAERLGRLEAAQAAAAEQDAAAARRRRWKGKRRREEPDAVSPRAVPTTDPEARRLPNKDGGCRPNYTPVVVTEGGHGFIVDTVVNAEGDEASEMLGALERVEELRGEGSAEPLQVLADGAFVTGYHLAECERRGVDLVGPLAGVSRQAPAAVPQAKPGEALGAEVLAELPRSPATQRWDRRCFAYDAERDVYTCPLGEELSYAKTERVERAEGWVTERVYCCRKCVGCAWREQCVTERTRQGRTIYRSTYEACQQRQREKMQRPEAQAAYRRRSALVETVFGAVKGGMGVRGFLLRGKAKVATEWNWVCLGYNVGKLVNLVQRGAVRLAV